MKYKAKQSAGATFSKLPKIFSLILLTKDFLRKIYV